MKVLKSFFCKISAALAEQKRDVELGYTPRAREVFALAEEEAMRLNHNFIGTEHVLLGLVRLDRGVAANVLKRLGVDSHKVRTKVEECIPRGPDVNTAKPKPFTPRVEKALKIAHKEAGALNHSYVGTEHVLLGLLAEGEGIAALVLKELGLCASKTREEILKELQPNFEERDQSSPA